MFPEPRHRFIETPVGVAYYGFDHLHADAASGHNVIATVFMECGAFYNVDVLFGCAGSTKTSRRRVCVRF